MHCTDLQVAIVFRAVGPKGIGGGAEAPPHDFDRSAEPIQGLLHRWTSQLDLGITARGLERAVSVHNST